jgi:glycosyltransferase involved in cell wall biosynthesis
VTPSALPALTIVIPALNEEEAIGQTIQRTLDAVAEIQARGHVGRIEIIVVNDGSTDRTPQIAQAFVDRHPDGVKLIQFAKNRGYGTAIKEGFRAGSGDLLSFLDADGTCDPRFFGDLCAALQREEADVALGDRMGPDSEMPRVRRLGNRLFAFLLGFLSGEAVNDTASGMRVLRRAALTRIYPLPNGMDFTPAMSARAILQGLRVAEVPMPYAERVGQSKLRAVRDGLRFLRAILDAVLFYHPVTVFRLGFTFCLMLFAVLAIGPSEFYLRNGWVEEWMIYRFVGCLVLANGGFLLLSAAAIADDLHYLNSRTRRRQSFASQMLDRLFSKWLLVGGALAAVLTATALVWSGLVEYIVTRHVTLHWSRVLVAAVGYLFALQCIITASLRRILALWRHYLSEAPVSRPEAPLPSDPARLVAASPPEKVSH